MAAVAPPLSLEDAVAEFLGALGSERGLSANTIAAYRRDLRRYVEALHERGRDAVGVVTAADVEAYVSTLRGGSLAQASIARKISAVRSLHRFLVAEDLADVDPTAGLETPRRRMALPKALTVEEVERLLAAPDRATPLGTRDAALLEFLYASGARVSEAVGLDVLDLDLDERVALVTGKGSRQRVVPIGRLAVEAVEAYLPVRMDLRRGRRDPGRLFLNARGGPLTRQGVWQIVRKHARAAGLDADRVSPHVLRHCAATHMVEGGADLRTVQEMLGHASISTTQIYTRVSPQHLLEVFISTHPRSR
jgi:integrase/recombinase XerD